jgi:sugar phosphate isomerase/epimerase
MRAIIGWSGLVGQTLVRAYPDADIYNSSNINDICGKEYDDLFMCGMPAEKWKINKAPDADYATLSHFIRIFDTVKVGRFILISTVDVLDCSVEQDESGASFAEHPYGKHRRFLEEYVIRTFPNHHILRLPGLVGGGLKKNIIYDLLNDNQVENVCLDSEFQWYSLDNLHSDINRCIDANLKLINIVSPPISVRSILTRFFLEKLELCKGSTVVKYRLRTGYNVEGYWKSYDATFDDLSIYIEREKYRRRLPFSLAVSNIAWPDTQFNEVHKVLTSAGIRCVEIAPTKFCSWEAWGPDIFSRVKARPVSYLSCQSILFGVPIEIFKEMNAFKAHYENVCGICKELGVKAIVFGSPKARKRYDTTDEEARDLFREIGEISARYGVVCCIEPNASAYGCTWLTTLEEVYSFVRDVDHPYVQINFDFGNYIMENDTTEISRDLFNRIGHVQISSQFLKPLCYLQDIDIQKYRQLMHVMKEYNYSNVISLEMVECTIQDLIRSLSVFVSLV